MNVRRASFPDDTKSIHSLIKYIDLSVYPEPANIENPDDQWFVYEEKRKVIGCAAATRSRGEIRHIVVLPNHRRSGIGSKLVNCTTDFLKNTGHSRIWAQVRVKNKESQRLFEKSGFERQLKLIRSSKDPKVKLYKYVLTP